MHHFVISDRKFSSNDSKLECVFFLIQPSCISGNKSKTIKIWYFYACSHYEFRIFFRLLSNHNTKSEFVYGWPVRFIDLLYFFYILNQTNVNCMFDTSQPTRIQWTEQNIEHLGTHKRNTSRISLLCIYLLHFEW